MNISTIVSTKNIPPKLFELNTVTDYSFYCLAINGMTIIFDLCSSARHLIERVKYISYSCYRFKLTCCVFKFSRTTAENNDYNLQTICYR